MLLRIGTRGSPLALAQANEIRGRLEAIHAIAVDRIKLDVIRTTGDAIRDRPLAQAGGKGLFTKEIDEALLAGVIAAVPPREDARDVFISLTAKALRDLRSGAKVGTASLRRQALLKRLRPDLTVVNFRGNVETRLRKLEEGVVDATLLALAGLRRLGLVEKATAVLAIDEFLPAVGQGCLAVVARADDTRVLPLIAPLNYTMSAQALTAERAFLAVLDGSCRTPIAGYDVVTEDRLHFQGLIAKPDGSRQLRVEREGPRDDAVLLGAEAGRELKAQAGGDFFAHS